MTGHRVQCGEFSRYMDPDEEWEVAGFGSAEAAQAYARRFIRASVERMRDVAASPEEILRAYYAYGEYAATDGLDSREWARFCATNPAERPEDTDYRALDPRGDAPPR